MCTLLCCNDTRHISIFINLFFLFKQKTAYELRISDWSSDVCSSDLLALIVERAFRRPDRLADHLPRYMQIPRDRLDRLPTSILAPAVGRSEERRVGKEGVSTCRSRWSQAH